MARRRFRWTRKEYEHAAWLSRFTGRHLYELPEQPPDLLRRYWELWERRPQHDDPLLESARHRLNRKQDTDEIPF